MRRYLIPLLPALLGAACATVWQAGLWPDPVLYLRADLSTLLLLLGLLLSLLWAAGQALWRQAMVRCERRLERERQEHSAAHRRFVRRLDHEIKNPLTAIRAGLANLQAGDEGAGWDDVRRQVDRLARLSAELVKLAELEQQPLEEAPVDVALLLEELLEFVRARPEALARQWSLAISQVPWPLPPVHGDRDLLFLALHNLLDNALKFTRPGDAVEIRALEDGAMVAIEIADTGPGIPSEELPHLGQELYRGSAARGIEGSGLGLALAHAILARHGGSMGIRSREGQGTVVTVRLPVRRQGGGATHPAAVGG